MKTIWYQFECRNNACGWKTPGTYNFENRPELTGCCPDSDCPKCGCHDSVCDTDREIPEPADVKAVADDINSGPHGYWDPRTEIYDYETAAQNGWTGK